MATQDYLKVTVKPDQQVVTYTGATTNLINIGDGVEIYAGMNILESEIRTLSGGTNTTVTVSGDTIVIASTLETSGFTSTVDFNAYTGSTNSTLTGLTETTNNLTQDILEISGITSGLTETTNNLEQDILEISGITSGLTETTNGIIEDILEISGITSGLTGTYVELSVFDTYTGTTVPNLLDGKSNTGHTHDYGTLNNLPTLFTGNTYVGSGATVVTKVGDVVTIYSSAVTGNTGSTASNWGEIGGTLSNQTDLQTELDNKSNTGHTHTQYSPTGHTHDYSVITNKPDLGIYTTVDSFTGHTEDLSIHYEQSGITINQSQVTNLISDLADKSNTGHTHEYSVITNTPDLSVYALEDDLTGHTSNTAIHYEQSGINILNTQVSGLSEDLEDLFGHTSDTTIHYKQSGITINQSQVTNLVSDLADKSNTGHTHEYSVITNTPDLSVYALEDDLTGHTSNTTIHYEQSGITISQSQVTNLVSDLADKSNTGHTHTQYSPTGHTHEYSVITNTPDLTIYALEDDLTGHTSNTAIHYEQSGITILNTQVSGLSEDLQALFGHTSDTTIHYEQSGITINQSQVTNLTTDLGHLQTEIDDLSAIQSVGIYYVEHQASDISGYESLTESPLTITGSTELININANTVLFDSYSTPSQGLGVTGITAGLWTMHGHFTFSSITGSNFIHWDVYKRTSGGTETLLFRMSTPDINVTTLTEYQIESIQPEFTGFVPTDRLVLKIYAETTGGAKTATMSYASTTTYGFMQSPIKINSNPLWSSVYGKPAWLSPTSLASFESAHAHSQYATLASPTFTGTVVLPSTTSIGNVSATELDYVNGVTSAIQTQLDAKDNITATINAQSSTYTVVAGDNGKIIECTGTFTVTFPNSLATGFRCDVINVSTGVITLAASTTLQSAGTKLATQYTGASAYHRGSNVWLAVGLLTT